MNTFQFAAASVMGKDHRIPGRNNQDAFFSLQTDEGSVALVTDGCSDGPHNEFGANFMARVGAPLILAGRLLGKDWEEIRQELLRQLQVIVDMAGGRKSLFVREYLLFTMVGVIILPDLTEFFSIGDGVIYVNGERIRIGPFPKNEPPYLAYGLVHSSLDPALLRFQIHRTLPTSELNNFLVGTDGVEDLEHAASKTLPGNSSGTLVGDVSAFWSEDRFFRSPDLVRRHLFLANGGIHHPQLGLLGDDTTLVVGRQKRKLP